MRPNPTLAVALALSLHAPAGLGPPKQAYHQPYNVGRNKEKEALRLAKAEAKRERKQDRRKPKA
jgi:hypothetical protein